MQEAFGIVIFAVVAIGCVVALITFVVSRKAYDDIGRGAFAMRDDVPSRAPAPAPSSPAALRERDEEIRQLLAARNERRSRRGQAPLDVEAELKRLTGPTVDSGLRAEVRQLVVARNERRQRAGKEPLDVDAEVERQLRELSG
ncbi:MAG TPA: hypothetical protein VHR88_06835 [Solirubrobacteraceae bacterium]|nr:hypothetical protein [Solirubrobacteraceae bacterium]